MFTTTPIVKSKSTNNTPIVPGASFGSSWRKKNRPKVVETDYDQVTPQKGSGVYASTQRKLCLSTPKQEGVKLKDTQLVATTLSFSQEGSSQQADSSLQAESLLQEESSLQEESLLQEESSQIDISSQETIGISSQEITGFSSQENIAETQQTGFGKLKVIQEEIECTQVWECTQTLDSNLENPVLKENRLDQEGKRNSSQDGIKSTVGLKSNGQWTDAMEKPGEENSSSSIVQDVKEQGTKDAKRQDAKDQGAKEQGTKDAKGLDAGIEKDSSGKVKENDTALKEDKNVFRVKTPKLGALKKRKKAVVEEVEKEPLETFDYMDRQKKVVKRNIQALYDEVEDVDSQSTVVPDLDAASRLAKNVKSAKVQTEQKTMEEYQTPKRAKVKACKDSMDMEKDDNTPKKGNTMSMSVTKASTPTTASKVSTIQKATKVSTLSPTTKVSIASKVSTVSTATTMSTPISASKVSTATALSAPSTATKWITLEKTAKLSTPKATSTPKTTTTPKAATTPRKVIAEISTPKGIPKPKKTPKGSMKTSTPRDKVNTTTPMHRSSSQQGSASKRNTPGSNGKLSLSLSARKNSLRKSILFDREYTFAISGFGEISDGVKGQIRNAGATVVDDLLHVSNISDKPVFVIAPMEGLRRKNALLALACGVPVLHPDWLSDCFREKQLLDFQGYYQPRGISVLEKPWTILTEPAALFATSKLKIGFLEEKSHQKDRVSFYATLLKLAGATNVIEKLSLSSLSTVHVIISSTYGKQCKLARSKCPHLPILHQEWVIECLIAQEILSISDTRFMHPKSCRPPSRSSLILDSTDRFMYMIGSMVRRTRQGSFDYFGIESIHHRSEDRVTLWIQKYKSGDTIENRKQLSIHGDRHLMKVHLSDKPFDRIHFISKAMYDTLSFVDPLVYYYIE